MKYLYRRPQSDRLLAFAILSYMICTQIQWLATIAVSAEAFFRRVHEWEVYAEDPRRENE